MRGLAAGDRFEEVLDLAPPRAGEVLVRVAAAGVCHSDLHLADGHLGDGRWPIVLGHEGAGVVEAVGAGVDRPRRATPSRSASCRRAAVRACPPGGPTFADGRQPLAGRQLLDGTSRLRTPGRIAAPALQLRLLLRRALRGAGGLRRPDPAGAAVVAGGAARMRCGHRLRRRAERRRRRGRRQRLRHRLRRGRAAGRAGARLAGAAPIVAVDRDEAKLELARARGATHAVDPAAGNPVERVLDRRRRGRPRLRGRSGPRRPSARPGTCFAPAPRPWSSASPLVGPR